MGGENDKADGSQGKESQAPRPAWRRWRPLPEHRSRRLQVLDTESHGRRQARDLGLGGYPGVSLAEVRNLASDKKRAVMEEHNPVFAKKTDRAASKVVPTPAPGVPTFREAAAVVHDLNSAIWDNVKTRNNWWQRAERYVFPAIGNMPIDQIGRTEVLDVLTPVWTTKPETARRIRLIIKTAMAWRLAYGHITINPAAGSFQSRGKVGK